MKLRGWKEVFLPFYDKVVLAFLISAIVTALVNWAMQGEALRSNLILICTALLVIWCLYYLQLRDIQISEEIRNDLLVDQKLRKNGIEKVYTNREEYFDEFATQLKGIFTGSSKYGIVELKMQGISLRGFFNHDQISSSHALKQIHNLLMNAVAKKKIALKALILDPQCQQAEIRMRSDRQGTTSSTETSKLKADIDSAVSIFLKGDQKEHEHDAVLPFAKRVPSDCSKVCTTCVIGKQE
jgi:hypothetical protein